ncbi:MAG: hypothetical protein IT308_05570 [Anaerolineaceae bacterium]|nr:hypothetical protein [Anaerolineaceae bacterium]
MAENVDLAKIFQAVTKNLTQNQESLNQADGYNHDHGDNVVQVFNLITKAMKAKKGADVSAQLAYAGDYLGKNNQSGSGKAYALGLAQAASQFQGQTLTPENAMGLVGALLGGGQASAAESSSSPAGDLLGALLGGGQAQKEPQGGMDSSQLLAMGLNIGMNFLEARQQGRSNMEALVQSVVAGSQMGQTPHRAQSANIIASTLMTMLTSGSKKN